MEEKPCEAGFNKVVNCFKTSRTEAHVKTSAKVYKNFCNMYSPVPAWMVIALDDFYLSAKARVAKTSKMTCFISGHRDVTKEEFNKHYKHLINDAITNGYTVVVGDYEGLDLMAQEYLMSCNYINVYVYHMFKSPRNHVEGFPTVGGYDSDIHRDWNMTLNSDYDIAWVRDGKETSGTAQNIHHRTLKELHGEMSYAELKERNKQFVKGHK